MLKRTITGAVYVAVIAGFFLLRQFVDYRLFNIFIAFFMTLGTFELVRAIRERLFKGVFIFALIFGVLFVPLYCVGEYILTDIINANYFGKTTTYGWFFCIIYIFVSVITVSIISLFNLKNQDEDSNKSLPFNILPFVYPSIFILSMLLMNDLGVNSLGEDIGFIALLSSFIIAPLADTFAYLTGRLIGGPKLAPVLSPKKTWSGAIGGVLGAVGGMIALYFIVKPQIEFQIPIILFVLLGFFGSILTIIGDLAESSIKRKVGIKDMGKIMPGHGGILDRIDGQLFASVYVYLLFLVL